MKVTLTKSDRGYRARVQSRLILLDRFVADTLGGVNEVELDVMVTRALLTFDQDSKTYRNDLPPYGYVVRPITKNDILVSHRGFETAGSPPFTAAVCRFNSALRTIVPNRSKGLLYIADNCEAQTMGSPQMPLIPGRVYVKDSFYNELSVVVEGLPDISDTDEFLRSNSRAYWDWKVRKSAWEQDQAGNEFIQHSQCLPSGDIEYFSAGQHH